MKSNVYYASYLLRFWREERDDGLVWQAEVESILTGESWHFSELSALYEFLEGRIELANDVVSVEEM